MLETFPAFICVAVHRVDALNCCAREGQRLGALVASHASLLTPSSNLNRSLGDLNKSSNLRTGFEERLCYLEGSGAGGGKERKEGAPWDPRFPT